MFNICNICRHCIHLLVHLLVFSMSAYPQTFEHQSTSMIPFNVAGLFKLGFELKYKKLVEV